MKMLVPHQPGRPAGSSLKELDACPRRGFARPLDDRWPNTDAKTRAFAIYRHVDALDPATVEAHELTPEERSFLRFAPEAQPSVSG